MTFYTSRTEIKPIEESDINDVLLMYLEPDSFKYIAPHKDKSKDYYVDFLNGKIEANKIQTGFWVVRDRYSAELIGTVNLNSFKAMNINHVGCHLRTKFWNQGFAKELCAELLRFGFEERKLKQIHGVVEEGNLVSAKLMKSLGFSLKQTIEIDGCKLNIFHKTK